MRIDQTLFTIDQVLSIGAVLVLSVLVVSQVVRATSDPLRSAPSRPNHLREDALAMVVVVYLLAAIAVTLLTRGLNGSNHSIWADVWVGVGAQSAGITACLIVGATRFEGGIKRFWRARGATGWWRSGLLVVLIAILAVGFCPVVRDVTAAVILYFAPGFEFAQHPTIHALDERGQPVSLVLVLWGGAIVLAPVAEELFFRGLLQTFLVGVLASRWKAIAMAAIAFAAVHFQQLHAVPALAVLAVFIGYAYERTGSLVVPILIHSLFNLKTLVWELLAPHAAA